MPTEPSLDFLEILRTLVEHQVKFIVVGGVSAVLQGAPFTAFDVDIVHSRDPENVERLILALESLSATYRTMPSKPNASHLTSAGHQLLITRHGPLDVSGMIGDKP